MSNAGNIALLEAKMMKAMGITEWIEVKKKVRC